MERKKLRHRSEKVRLLSLDDLDRRTASAKAALRLRAEIVADLGGEDRLSAMERAIVNNAAVIAAMLESMATKYLAGQAIELGSYATLSNSLRRLLQDVGLQRRALDVQTDLRSYMKAKAKAA
jgi:hypothetical protein